MASPLRRSSSSQSLTEFKNIDDDEAVSMMASELSKVAAVAKTEQESKEMKRNNDGFLELFQKYLEERGSKIRWDDIKPPSPEMIVKYKNLPEPSASKPELLSKLAVLKLNGGLGTSMGCVGPKSIISVRSDLTFLDLCVRQIEYLNMNNEVDVPLVLMNSFNTHDDTLKILRKYASKKVRVLTFNQSQYPRILKESLLPLPTSKENPAEWYPPGHGDLYRSIHECGLLDELLSQGKEWLFVSNIDNLGAVVDTNILSYLCDPSNEAEFVMEVTDKTRADVKGGTLINYQEQVRLLEVAQVPKKHLEEFKSVTKFRVFNTNNLWINLKALKERMEKDGFVDMEVIENKKTLDDGRSIIQLEQAVGSGIKNFKNAIGINVPRSRFLPVKKTSDLLLVMSNLYVLRHGRLMMNEARLFPTVPLIKLGDSHFKKVKEFLKRFDTIPDIVELDHLTVSGDVNFGKNVTLRGTVIVIANEEERIDIPDGAILENKIVTGNLRILDH